MYQLKVGREPVDYKAFFDRDGTSAYFDKQKE